jgi:hypothetical protein
MSESNGLETKKSTLSFGFSKTKPKTNLTQKSQNAFVDEISESNSKSKSNEKELITSIEGKKVNALNQNAKLDKRPLIIPCKKNELLINSKASSNVVPNDLDKAAFNALVEEAGTFKEKKQKDNKNISIDLNQSKAKINTDNIEDPNYEAIDLEQFGMIFSLISFELN